MSANQASETSSFAERRQVIKTTIGGHEFTITEPGWRTAGRAVALFVRLIGNRPELDALVRDMTAVFGDADLDDDTRNQRVFQIAFKAEDEIAALDDDGIAELLGMVTDKPAEWYGDDALSFDDVMALLGEVASVLPFGRVCAQRGLASMAFLTSWTNQLAASVRSSGGNSGSDGESSGEADLAGLRVSPPSPESNEAQH